MYKKIYKSPISNIVLTRTNNNLISYGGGIKNKIKLLEIEGNNIKEYKIQKKGNKLWKKDAVGATKTMNYTSTTTIMSGVKET